MSSTVGRVPKALGVLMVSVIALAALSVVPRTMHAQEKTVVNTKGAKSRGGGADANVKSDSLPANKAGATVPVPPSKGGPKTRGSMSGTLHVDNRTPYIIRIYVDGDYVGNVSRFGDSYGYYGCSVRALYARAYFDDGSTISWGPIRRDLCDDFTWRLNP